MTEDETIVTPVLTKAIGKWRMWGPWAAAALAWAWSMSNTLGHKQANTEMLSGKLDEVISEQRAQRQETQKVREDVASLKTAVEDVKSNQDDFKRWKDRVTGVADSTPIQRLTPQGRRTHH